MSTSGSTSTCADRLSRQRIESLPSSFYYVPDFVTAEEQSYILGKLPPNKWISLSRRRLQVHPAQLTNNNVLLDAPLPSWLTSSPSILKRFRDLGIFEDAPHGSPNHCLINEYGPGQGIMPHEDGTAYHPIVATISLGHAVALDIYEKRQDEGASQVEGLKPVTRILQEPGSLLVTTGLAYTSLLHGICGVEEDIDLNADTVANWTLLGDVTRSTLVQKNGRSIRGTRISLTYRDVLKVKKIALGIVGRR